MVIWSIVLYFYYVTNMIIQQIHFSSNWDYFKQLHAITVIVRYDENNKYTLKQWACICFMKWLSTNSLRIENEHHISRFLNSILSETGAYSDLLYGQAMPHWRLLLIRRTRRLVAILKQATSFRWPFKSNHPFNRCLLCSLWKLRVRHSLVISSRLQLILFHWSIGFSVIINMMTSSNHFPRYWPFVRGIHRSRWILPPKASDAELWCFLWFAPE